jgi:hypothetical protein
MSPIMSPGDPAFLWVYPRGNWLNRYLFRVGSGEFWCHDHITVTARTSDWDLITLAGEPLPAYTEIPGTGHGFAYIPVPDPQYELLAPGATGVEVKVYGYVGHGSYLYPGGMGLTTLNPEG